jgi:hypothetical protein
MDAQSLFAILQQNGSGMPGAQAQPQSNAPATGASGTPPGAPPSPLFQALANNSPTNSPANATGTPAQQQGAMNNGDAPTTYGPNQQFTNPETHMPIPNEAVLQSWYGPQAANNTPVPQPSPAIDPNNPIVQELKKRFG